MRFRSAVVLGLGWAMSIARAAEPNPAPATASPVDLAYTVRAVGSAPTLRPDNRFAAGIPLTGFDRDNGRLDAEARGHVGPLALLLTGTASDAEGEPSSTRGIINEAYLDFGSGAWRGTIGRKILSADVGYAFRPIDVLQRETRLLILPPALEGIDHLAIERFSADEAWTFIVAQPTSGHRGQPKDDRSLAVRYYRRVGKADLHAVARFSERYKVETGAAASLVATDSVELHGSVLWQRRGERLAPASAWDPPRTLAAPLASRPANNTGKALAGATWTFTNGFSLVGETWWDGTAPTAADWRGLAERARQIHALAADAAIPAPAIAGSLATALQMFQSASLSRRAAVAHFAWSDPSGGPWSAAVDVLHSFDDGSGNITVSITRQGDKLRLDAGVRGFFGNSRSVYGLLPQRRTVYLGAAFAF